MESSATVSGEVLRSHCQYVAMNYLKDNFPPDRVAQMDSYLKSERSIVTKTHKRYITIPSAKRLRGEDFIQYAEDKMEGGKTFEEAFQPTAIKPETVETVMPGNLILVGNSMPQDPNLVIHVQNGPEMPMM